MEIAVRSFNQLRERKHEWEPNESKQTIPSYERVFVFDTETRIDVAQSLTFGSFVIMHHDAVEQLGLFYDQNEVSEEELKILQSYCANDPTIKLYVLEDFIDGIFYPAVHGDKVPCVAFSLPWDISRLSIDYGYARRRLNGGFSFKLSNNKEFPAVRVKRIAAGESIIQFQTTNYSKFRGFFIDCQLLAAMFTDDKHISLAEACDKYNKIHKKLEVSEHGVVTKKYITYNIEDTLATAELFTHLKAEYDRFGVKLPLPAVVSSASIGKTFLKELGIRPYMKLNPHVSPELFGRILGAYFGGRVEARIRKQPCRVTALDFTSTYPTLFILLGLYEFLVAERIEHFDDTENVRKFLERVTLDDLRDPAVWKTLSVIVELRPDNDLLPVRAAYDKENLTVGLNYLSSDQTFFYGLPSIVLSRLLTNKVPKILSATRFVPVGRQNSLTKAKILGVNIDPETDNIFKIIVEAKQRSRLAKDGRDRQLKILANSSSYGIYIELDPEDKKSEVMIYGRNEKFVDFKRFEKEGKYFNPIISTLITDGTKLLLGLGDCILQKYNEVVAYADTDSLYVPPQHADEVMTFFDALNPYDTRLVEHLLKVEEKETWLYAISAKRYVLYDIDAKGNFVIKPDNYSLHGLGHLLNPFGKEVKDWQKEIWLDILRFEYKQIEAKNLLDKYRNFYAISQFKVSTVSLMKRFSALNRGKLPSERIRPLNFFLIGFGNDEDVKPIAPFSRDSQIMPHSPFINYKNGKVMEGLHYFKSLADELWAYIYHPEAKLSGDVGLLERKHITATKVVYVGKEADRVEESLNGLHKMNYNIYRNPKDVKKRILSLTWSQVKQCGIPESQFYALKKQLKQGKQPRLSGKTWNRLMAIW
jgi:hypothetical protein